MSPSSSPIRVAAIDIGSNSIHMVVAAATDSGQLEVLDREKEMVKLGAPVFATGEVDAATFKNAVALIRRYARIADGQGALDIIAVATSAVREARNGNALLRAFSRAAGVKARTISGSEEARLIWLAVHEVLAPEQPSLVLDIGGGSVELAWGNARGFSDGVSLKLGVQRLRERFGGGKLPPDGRRELEKHARRMLRRCPDVRPASVIGTSGTIRELAALCSERHGYGTAGRKAITVSRKELSELRDDLCEMSASERARVADERRSETLHLGAVVVVELLSALDVESLIVCDATLREGVIIDYLQRHRHWHTHPFPGGVRPRAVVSLAQRYGRAVPHDWHVRYLAERLFEVLRPIHQLDDGGRELLGYAALLHAIGEQVRYKKYHKHGRYILLNSVLYGLESSETRILAHTVRYHRKKRPKRKAKKLRKLPKPEVDAIMTLSALLRLAVALDRGTTQVVADVELVDANSGRARLGLRGNDDMSLELWAAKRSLRPLEKVLDRKIHIGPGLAREDMATKDEVSKGEQYMSWDQIRGNWKELQGRARAKWGKLTDDDLHRINGKKEELLGALQKRYGYQKEEAKRRVEEWVDSVKGFIERKPTPPPS